jgi:GTPase SAR1 family protein
LSDVVPTIGFEPQKFNFRSYNLTINDLGGGERVRDLWKHYMAESFGYIYVIDSSNRKRIEETKKEFTQFLNNPRVSGKPVLL